jgi:hypothetical protein
MRLWIVAAALLLSFSSAQAATWHHRHHRHHHVVRIAQHHAQFDLIGDSILHGARQVICRQSCARHHVLRVRNMAQGLGYGLKHMLDSMQPHPAGCPRTAFCGCGVSIRVFGHSVRSLWLAANWFRFPRTYARSGAVAVRAHHVFYIEESYGDGTVLAYDPNSGHHLTRLHRVRLNGYTIVDPSGGV